MEEAKKFNVAIHQNVRSVGSNEKGLNPKVERLNGTVRDREVPMSGMDRAESAQELMDAMRIHYNFIRSNQAIGGQKRLKQLALI